MKRFCSLVILLSMSVSAAAENWPQFRGPNFNGSSDEKNLPDSWSMNEGVVWSVDLPGASAATLAHNVPPLCTLLRGQEVSGEALGPAKSVVVIRSSFPVLHFTKCTSIERHF